MNLIARKYVKICALLKKLIDLLIYMLYHDTYRSVFSRESIVIELIFELKKGYFNLKLIIL